VFSPRVATRRVVARSQCQAANRCSANKRSVGVCLGAWGPIYVLSSLSVCGFVTTLSGGVCGSGCSTLGGGFGLVGGRVDIHIRVCMSNSGGLRNDVLLPPRFALSEQVAVAKFVLADTL
jgi:hypothetical protein